MEHLSFLFFLCLISIPILLFAETNDNNAPPSEGNFALSSSQQPGAFLSFGQTLIGKNALQLAVASFSPYHINMGPFNNLNAMLTYGITDDMSLYANFPLSADSHVRGHAFHGLSSGLQDVSLQLEKAFYTTDNRHYQDQATLVGAVTLPMQDADMRYESKGYGTLSYFLGTTFTRTYVDWLGFFSPGMLLTQPKNNIRLGSQLLYQAGIGRTLLAIKDQSDLFVLVEIDGQYTYKNEVLGHSSPNSGGNVIALTPSLALISPHVMTQVGVGFPIVQQLYGMQKHMDFFIAAQLTWSIN